MKSSQKKRKTRHSTGGKKEMVQKEPKSKLLLLFLTILGLNHFYVGNTGLGILKIVTVGGFIIWYVVDVILVLINALSKSRKGVLGIESFNDETDINRSFYASVLISLLYIITTLFGNHTNLSLSEEEIVETINDYKQEGVNLQGEGFSS